jgi:DNA-binding transcriptional ArsR family regulator
MTRRVEATIEQIRAMVHPLRLRIVETLQSEGPLTATRLAELLGHSSGVTSYHLRVLGEAGVLEEVPERGRGRERWWRAAEPPLYIPTDAGSADERALKASARLMHLERDEAAVRRFMLGVAALPDEWQNAAFTGSFAVRLTAAEVWELGMRFFDLVEELRATQHADDDAGVRDVIVTLRAVPWVE